MPQVDSLADIQTVGDITRHQAKDRPDRAAIHFEGRRITFGELDRNANQVANGLIAEGLRPQARIAILSKNVPAFFDLWFGGAKADVVLVPVNFRLAPPEVAYVIADAAAEVLFVGADFYSLVEKVAHEMKSVRRIIALDGGHSSWPDYATWLAEQLSHDPALPIPQEHCAIQMYTSGTTGNPKGAQLSHANLLPLAQGGLRHLGNWHENDVNLVCMPLFHIGGSGWALIGFYRGVDTVLMRDADPGAILRMIAGISRYQGVHGAGASAFLVAASAVPEHGFLVAGINCLWRLARAGRPGPQCAEGVWLRLGAGLRIDRDHRRHHLPAARGSR